MPLGGIGGPEPWSALAAPIDESPVGSLSSSILTAGLLVGASGLPGAALPSPGIGTSVESASAEQRDRPQQPVEPAPIPTPAEAEYFVLLRPVGGADAEADLEDEPIGVLRHVRLQRQGPDWQVEQEALLFGPEVRLHTLEGYRGDECRLVFREQVRGAGSRTLRAHWPLSRSTPPLGDTERVREWEPAVVQWFGDRRSERIYEGARGWQGPLGLLERLRWGLASEGEVARFEVLSGSPEVVRVRSFHSPTPFPFPPVAVHEFLDHQGAGRGWCVFQGDALVALGWQSGGGWARRTTRERYETLARRHPLTVGTEIARSGSETGDGGELRLRDFESRD